MKITRAGAISVTIENYTGADCTGTDGDLNRVLALTNTKLTTNALVYLDGLAMHTTQVTITHNTTGSTVQFLIAVWDNQLITVFYTT